jgi:hypothetical protein
VWTGTEGARTAFVPCRFARVTDSKVIGSSFVVQFEVKKFAVLEDGVDFASLLSEERFQK